MTHWGGAVLPWGVDYGCEGWIRRALVHVRSALGKIWPVTDGRKVALGTAFPSLYFHIKVDPRFCIFLSNDFIAFIIMIDA